MCILGEWDISEKNVCEVNLGIDALNQNTRIMKKREVQAMVMQRKYKGGRDM